MDLKSFFKRTAKRNCQDCINPDCPAGRADLEEFQIRVLNADLYDMSTNLLDQLVMEPDAKNCQWFMTEQDKPKPEKQEKIKSRKLGREIEFLQEQVKSLSQSLKALTEKPVETEKAGPAPDVTAQPEQTKFNRETLLNRKALDDLQNQVDDIRALTESKQVPESIIQDIEKLKQSFAKREKLDELAIRLEQLSSSTVDREALDELSETLNELRSRMADREHIEELASGLEQLQQGAADREDLSGVAEQLRELHSKSADRETLDDLAILVERLSETSADKDAVEELSKQVREVRSRFSDLEMLDEYIYQVNQVSQTSAKQELVDKIAEQVEDIGSRFTDREIFDKLAFQVKLLSSTSADIETVDKISEQVEDIRSRFTDRSLFDKLSVQVEKLSSSAAEREVVEKISEKLEDVRARFTERKLFDELSSTVEKLGFTAADKKAVQKISAKVDDIGSRFTDRKLFDELSSTVEKLGLISAEKIVVQKISKQVDDIQSKFTDRKQHEELNSRVKQLSASAAEKKVVDKISAQVDDIGSRFTDRKLFDELSSSVKKLGASAAEQKVVNKISAQVDDIRAKFTDRKLFDELSSEVKRLGSVSAERELVEEISAKLEDVSSRFIERVQFDKLAGQFKQLSTTSADRAQVSKVNQSVEQVSGRVGKVEAAHKSLGEILDREVPLSAAERERVDDLLDRYRELEQGATELRKLVTDSGLPVHIEQRLTSLEKRLVEFLCAVSGEDGVESLANVDGLDLLFERMSKVEDDRAELERQIRKAFENLTNYPLKELNGLKDKVAGLEKSHKQLDRVTKFLPVQVRKERRLATAAILTVLILISALMLGYWKWISAEASAPSPLKDELADYNAPNTVYDDAELWLEPPTLDIANQQFALTNGSADITGYAPGAVDAYLFLNNEQVATCTVENYGFSFAGISLDYGVNVIEVKVTDTKGNEASSMASILERMSRSAAKVRTSSVINRMRGPRGVPNLALTIDAGASSRRAEKILDVLREKGIITTFFLTGQFIERYPDIVKRIVMDGHEVGNHTYSHPHLTTYEQNRRHFTNAGVNKQLVERELIRTKQLFESLTGVSMVPWWRAPYGEQNPEIREWAKDAGFKHIDWTRTPTNHDMLDWVADESHKHYLDSRGLFKRLTNLDGGQSGKANGGIVLMHLGTERRKDYLDEILPGAIDNLRKRGYKFVTISRMFSD